MWERLKRGGGIGGKVVCTRLRKRALWHPLVPFNGLLPECSEQHITRPPTAFSWISLLDHSEEEVYRPADHSDHR